MKHGNITVASISNIAGTDAPSAGPNGSLGPLALRSDIAGNVHVHGIDQFADIYTIPEAHRTLGGMVYAKDKDAEYVYYDGAFHLFATGSNSITSSVGQAFSGQVSCVSGQATYSIYHDVVTDPKPLVSLVIPNSGSAIHVEGIHSVSVSGFQVTLSSSLVSSDYKINWYVTNIEGNVTGVERFTQLLDVPSSYAGKNGYFVSVSGDGLIFRNLTADLSNALTGQIDCVTGQRTYTISHAALPGSIPTASLVIPTSGDAIFLEGIHDISSTGFKVTLSTYPYNQNYKINWHVLGNGMVGGASSLDGSGANNMISFFTDSNTLTGDPRLTYDRTTNELTIDGKLTVTGIIDPTGLTLTPVAANPGNTKTLWINSGDSNKLYFGASSAATPPSNLGAISLYNFTNDVVPITAASVTLSQASHGGRFLLFTNAGGCTVTCPGSLPLGFGMAWKQSASAGQISFVVTGGTLENASSHTKSRTAKSQGTIAVFESTIITLAGDTGT